MGRRRKEPVRYGNIEIIDIADKGKAVARIDSKVVFVQDAVPGDVVDIEVFKKRSSFMEGRVTALITPSEFRTEPFCEYFGTCGGCKWQNLDYQAQLRFKTKQVEDSMSRIAKVEVGDFRPILSSPHTREYRNKLEFTFTDARWLTADEIASEEELGRQGLGFHIPGRFDKVLNIDRCYLQTDPSNKIRNFVRDTAEEMKIPFFNQVHQTGVLRNLIIRTSNTGQVMAILQITKASEDTANLLEKTAAKFPEITSLNFVVNSKRNETFHDLEVRNYCGKNFIEEDMTAFGSGKTLTFQIGPKSFFQTNSEQAATLYQTAAELADFKGDEIVYDLYSGTGTIACFVADAVKSVVGMEYVPDAIRDARKNAKNNRLENTAFYAGDIKDLLTDEVVKKHGKPDVIITDPPRAGMHGDVVKKLLEITPEKIIYISCNPATQARDIELMKEHYHVRVVQPVDMFPHTHHVENIALLELI